MWCAVMVIVLMAQPPLRPKAELQAVAARIAPLRRAHTQPPRAQVPVLTRHRLARAHAPTERQVPAVRAHVLTERQVPAAPALTEHQVPAAPAHMEHRVPAAPAPLIAAVQAVQAQVAVMEAEDLRAADVERAVDTADEEEAFTNFWE